MWYLSHVVFFKVVIADSPNPLKVKVFRSDINQIQKNELGMFGKLILLDSLQQENDLS